MRFSNRKWILVLPLMMVLSGCIFSNTVQETKYKNQYPPDYLMVECYPDKPETATLGEVIRIQSAALDQCNNQLSALRFWKEQNNNNEDEEQQE